MARPSRARGRVLAFAFLLTVITYLDRICISAAAPAMMTDLHLTVPEMSVVFSAFTLAYAVFEVPSGWLGDRRGPRRVLTRIVLWWSAFTMLTGLAGGLRSLVAVRFLFGAGEAGAFPNLSGAFSRWFPARERGRATGVMMLGSRGGGMLSGPIALLLIARWGWRASFCAFGVLGLAWSVAWHTWYRDDPAQHPAVDRDELAWIRQDDASAPPAGGTRADGATPWRAILHSRNLYAICLMYFGYAYGLYFYFTWLPTYLLRELGFSALRGGLFAALPFLLAGIANVAGGWLTDTLVRRHGLRVGRCGLGCVAFSGASALTFASTLALPPVAKAVLLACALGSADLALGACWATPVDIAPRHAGVMTGFMNSFGNVGGILAPLVIGLAVDRWQSWTLPFYIAGAVYGGAALAWLAIDPRRPVEAPAALAGCPPGVPPPTV
jgi:MFS family permease